MVHQPLVIKCAGCGAHLPLATRMEEAVCSFCGTQNLLPSVPASPAFESDLGLALRQLRNGLVPTAEQTVIEALRRNPESGDAWLVRFAVHFVELCSQTLRRVDAFEQVQEAREKALELKSSDA